MIVTSVEQLVHFEQGNPPRATSNPVCLWPWTCYASSSARKGALVCVQGPFPPDCMSRQLLPNCCLIGALTNNTHTIHTYRWSRPPRPPHCSQSAHVPRPAVSLGRLHLQVQRAVSRKARMSGRKRVRGRGDRFDAGSASAAAAACVAARSSPHFTSSIAPLRWLSLPSQAPPDAA